MRELRYWKSAANFVLIDGGDRARALVDGMIAQGVFVRDRTKDPACPNCFRLTTGVVEHTRHATATLEALSRAPLVTTLSPRSRRDKLVLERDGETVEIPVNPTMRTNDAKVATRVLLAGQAAGAVQQNLVAEELAVEEEQVERERATDRRGFRRRRPR